MAASKESLLELQSIISHMPLHKCCTVVAPEFGLRWRELSRAIRNCRLPMIPSSVARVLYRHAAKTLTQDDADGIIQRLRLNMVASQDRKWHIVDLLEPLGLQNMDQLMMELPARVAQGIRQTRKGDVRPQVQWLLSNELLYMSVQIHTARGAGPVLYVCAPPGTPVAAVSSLSSSLLGAAVYGLGYRKHEDAKLHGKDVPSLLRIHNKEWSENAENLAGIPEYKPVPVITRDGIDYTYKTYNSNYVDAILGPNPPVLTELNIEMTKPFFDPSRLNKLMDIKIQLKTENVAQTLKEWVDIGALHPTSELLTVFTKVKGNRLVMNDDDE